MTARDYISASLRKIGAIASGESLGANEATDGLSSLNLMLSSWSTEGLMLPASVREVFALIPGQGAYTMGVGGNFNGARPEEITAALVQIPGAPQALELPIGLVTEDQFASIRVKALQSAYPQCMYAEGTAPLETLNFWPVPSGALNVVLYSEKALTQFADLTTSVTLPSGYDEAIIYNLAVRLAPEYGKTVVAEVGQIAIDTKGNLKRKNSKPLYLRVDSALTSGSRGFNWITGETT